MFFGYSYASESYILDDQWNSNCDVTPGNWACDEMEISSDGQFRFPTGIAVDQSGNVYVADFSNDRIQKFTQDGEFIAKWGSRGSDDGQFLRPYYIETDDSSNSVYVADFSNSRIQKFTPDGEFITKWGSRGSDDGQFGMGDGTFFTGPTGIAVDQSGNVYVADFSNDRIQKFTQDGEFITKWGSRGSDDGQFRFPTGIAVDQSGNVYVADSWNDRIQKFTPDGEFITKFDSVELSDGKYTFEEIFDLKISDKRLYVSDSRTDSIEIISFTN